MEDLRQSPEYGLYMEKIGWKVDHGIFIRKLGPVNIAKIQRTGPPKDLDRVLKENHVFMCKFEPLNGAKYEVLSTKGFKKDNWPLLGTKTLRITLSQSLSKIFLSFKKDCRYTLRKIRNSKFEIRKNAFDKFYEIWKKSSKRKNLWIPKEKEYWGLIESFGKKCFCITVGDDALLRQGYGGQAGAVILMHEKTAYYYYAGATKDGNEKNLPYLVVWEAMKEAKKRGCKTWDFEGIYDSRWPNKGWVGFSHFKKSFGGQEIEFPGSFIKWLWPF